MTDAHSSAGASPGTGRHWDDAYRTRAVDQVSWHQDSPATSLRLIGPRPGPDSRAVDVGGGTATLVDVLLRDGWTVTVLDVSAEALGITRRRLGAQAAKVSFVVSDVLAALLRAARRSAVGRAARRRARALLHARAR